MSTALSTPPVLVTGDVFQYHLLYTGHAPWPNSTREQGTRTVDSAGGAALLANVLSQLLEGKAVAPGPNQEDQSAWPRGFAVFDHFLADPADPKKGKVWRMKEVLGFDSPPGYEESLRSAKVDGAYGTIVIDDAGLAFRRHTARQAWPRCLTDEKATPPNWIVLKSQAPLASGDLWHHLLSDPRQLGKRCVLVIPAAHLRSEQIRITPGLSWERTALDLAGEFLSNPSLLPLKRSRFVIVGFDTDGALLADFTKSERPEFRLLFDPANLEGDWIAKFSGRVFGFQTTFAASIAAAIAGLEPNAADVRSNIERGIVSGLAGMRRLLEAGHGPANADPAFPFEQLAAEVNKPTWAYSVATVPADRPNWSIAATDPAGKARTAPLYGLARRVALNGVSALRGLPFQHFGKLFIVDRGEIESLRSLHRLVNDYNKREDTKPLSIAVFGAPGSGKSFGVKELSRAVLGDKVPILEFNLSQFDDASELLGLYHQVRDKVLEGRMPVVFWDEFDSKKLKWLQYLLAPMQDGRFQDGQISHPIGKCLFIFAGGTSHEFAGFGPCDTTEDRAAWNEFKSSKGPDFKSRLNGYLNVLGPNPRQIASGDDPSDFSFPIRRALLLRANLKLFGDERLTIDRGVLSAFLEVPRYLHGARSMEKIVEQTRGGAGSGRVGRSHLPPRQLLEMHVDADEFLALVERDLPFQFEAEPMAEAYHEFYRELGTREGWKSEFDMPYRDLPEFMKDDNRAAARRISEVVGLVGLYIVPIGQAPPGSSEADTRQAIEQNLELLAEGEHDGWVESRQRNGWEKGEPRNTDRRIHNRLVPYDQLPESEKQKDREAVKHYMEIVATAKYQIVTGPQPRRVK